MPADASGARRRPRRSTARSPLGTGANVSAPSGDDEARKAQQQPSRTRSGGQGGGGASSPKQTLDNSVQPKPVPDSNLTEHRVKTRSSKQPGRTMTSARTVDGLVPNPDDWKEYPSLTSHPQQLPNSKTRMNAKKAKPRVSASTASRDAPVADEASLDAEAASDPPTNEALPNAEVESAPPVADEASLDAEAEGGPLVADEVPLGTEAESGPRHGGTEMSENHKKMLIMLSSANKAQQTPESAAMLSTFHAMINDMNSPPVPQRTTIPNPGAMHKQGHSVKAGSQSDSHAPSKPPSGSSSGSENGSADDGAENPNNFTGADAEQTLKQRMKELKLIIDPAHQAEGRVPNDEERADLQLQLQDLSNELTTLRNGVHLPNGHRWVKVNAVASFIGDLVLIKEIYYPDHHRIPTADMTTLEGGSGRRTARIAELELPSQHQMQTILTSMHPHAVPSQAQAQEHMLRQLTNQGEKIHSNIMDTKVGLAAQLPLRRFREYAHAESWCQRTAGHAAATIKMIETKVCACLQMKGDKTWLRDGGNGPTAEVMRHLLNPGEGERDKPTDELLDAIARTDTEGWLRWGSDTERLPQHRAILNALHAATMVRMGLHDALELGLNPELCGTLIQRDAGWKTRRDKAHPQLQNDADASTQPADDGVTVTCGCNPFYHDPKCVIGCEKRGGDTPHGLTPEQLKLKMATAWDAAQAKQKKTPTKPNTGTPLKACKLKWGCLTPELQETLKHMGFTPARWNQKDSRNKQAISCMRQAVKLGLDEVATLLQAAGQLGLMIDPEERAQTDSKQIHGETAFKIHIDSMLLGNAYYSTIKCFAEGPIKHAGMTQPTHDAVRKFAPKLKNSTVAAAGRTARGHGAHGKILNARASSKGGMRRYQIIRGLGVGSDTMKPRETVAPTHIGLMYITDKGTQAPLDSSYWPDAKAVAAQLQQAIWNFPNCDANSGQDDVSVTLDLSTKTLVATCWTTYAQRQLTEYLQGRGVILRSSNTLARVKAMTPASDGEMVDAYLTLSVFTNTRQCRVSLLRITGGGRMDTPTYAWPNLDLTLIKKGLELINLTWRWETYETQDEYGEISVGSQWIDTVDAIVECTDPTLNPTKETITMMLADTQDTQFECDRPKRRKYGGGPGGGMSPEAMASSIRVRAPDAKENDQRKRQSFAVEEGPRTVTYGKSMTVETKIWIPTETAIFVAAFKATFANMPPAAGKRGMTYLMDAHAKLQPYEPELINQRGANLTTECMAARATACTSLNAVANAIDLSCNRPSLLKHLLPSNMLELIRHTELQTWNPLNSGEFKHDDRQSEANVTTLLIRSAKLQEHLCSLNLHGAGICLHEVTQTIGLLGEATADQANYALMVRLMGRESIEDCKYQQTDGLQDSMDALQSGLAEVFEQLRAENRTTWKRLMTTSPLFIDSDGLLFHAKAVILKIQHANLRKYMMSFYDGNNLTLAMDICDHTLAMAHSDMNGIQKDPGQQCLRTIRNILKQEKDENRINNGCTAQMVKLMKKDGGVPGLGHLLLQLDAAKAQDPDTIDDADDDDAWTSLRPELETYYEDVLSWNVDNVYTDTNEDGIRPTGTLAEAAVRRLAATDSWPTIANALQGSQGKNPKDTGLLGLYLAAAMIQVAGHQDQPPAKQLRFIGRDAAGNYVRNQVRLYPNNTEDSAEDDSDYSDDAYDSDDDDMHLDDDGDGEQTLYNQFDKQKDDGKRVGTLKIPTDDTDDPARQAGDEDIRQQGESGKVHTTRAQKDARKLTAKKPPAASPTAAAAAVKMQKDKENEMLRRQVALEQQRAAAKDKQEEHAAQRKVERQAAAADDEKRAAKRVEQAAADDKKRAAANQAAADRAEKDRVQRLVQYANEELRKQVRIDTEQIRRDQHATASARAQMIWEAAEKSKKDKKDKAMLKKATREAELAEERSEKKKKQDQRQLEADQKAEADEHLQLQNAAAEKARSDEVAAAVAQRAQVDKARMDSIVQKLAHVGNGGTAMLKVTALDLPGRNLRWDTASDTIILWAIQEVRRDQMCMLPVSHRQHHSAEPSERDTHVFNPPPADGGDITLRLLTMLPDTWMVRVWKYEDTRLWKQLHKWAQQHCPNLTDQPDLFEQTMKTLKQSGKTELANRKKEIQAEIDDKDQSVKTATRTRSKLSTTKSASLATLRQTLEHAKRRMAELTAPSWMDTWIKEGFRKWQRQYEMSGNDRSGTLAGLYNLQTVYGGQHNGKLATSDMRMNGQYCIDLLAIDGTYARLRTEQLGLDPTTMTRKPVKETRMVRLGITETPNPDAYYHLHNACIDSPEMVEHLRRSYDLFKLMLRNLHISTDTGKTDNPNPSCTDAMRLCTVRMLLRAQTSEVAPVEAAWWKDHGENILTAEIPGRRRHLARHLIKQYGDGSAHTIGSEVLEVLQLPQSRDDQARTGQMKSGLSKADRRNNEIAANKAIADDLRFDQMWEAAGPQIAQMVRNDQLAPTVEAPTSPKDETQMMMIDPPNNDDTHDCQCSPIGYDSDCPRKATCPHRRTGTQKVDATATADTTEHVIQAPVSPDNDVPQTQAGTKDDEIDTNDDDDTDSDGKDIDDDINNEDNGDDGKDIDDDINDDGNSIMAMTNTNDDNGMTTTATVDTDTDTSDIHDDGNSDDVNDIDIDDEDMDADDDIADDDNIGDNAAAAAKRGAQADTRTEETDPPTGNRPEEQQAQIEALSQQAGGRVGLRNLGNTCGLAAAIQVLVHIPEIQTYFTAVGLGHQDYMHDINLEPKHAGAVAKEFGDLVRTFVHADTVHDGTRYCTPAAFKAELDQWKPEFKGSRHQDSHDFLQVILDALHEGLKTDGKSIISQLFSIVWEPKMCCATPGCNGERMAAVEHATSICVEIPQRDHTAPIPTLADCITLSLEPETLEGLDVICPQCKNEPKAGMACKIDQITASPKILLIQVKRFEFNREDERCTKCNDMISFPLNNLHLPTHGHERMAMYDLFATVTHAGEQPDDDDNHYTACALTNGVWLKFDDSRMPMEIAEGDLQDEQAYMLLYRRRDSLKSAAPLNAVNHEDNSNHSTPLKNRPMSDDDAAHAQKIAQMASFEAAPRAGADRDQANVRLESPTQPSASPNAQARKDAGPRKKTKSSRSQQIKSDKATAAATQWHKCLKSAADEQKRTKIEQRRRLTPSSTVFIKRKSSKKSSTTQSILTSMTSPGGTARITFDKGKQLAASLEAAGSKTYMHANRPIQRRKRSSSRTAELTEAMRPYTGDDTDEHDVETIEEEHVRNYPPEAEVRSWCAAQQAAIQDVMYIDQVDFGKGRGPEDGAFAKTRLVQGQVLGSYYGTAMVGESTELQRRSMLTAHGVTINGEGWVCMMAQINHAAEKEEERDEDQMPPNCKVNYDCEGTNGTNGFPVIYTVRSIEPGEQLTFDYGPHANRINADDNSESDDGEYDPVRERFEDDLADEDFIATQDDVRDAWDEDSEHDDDDDGGHVDENIRRREDYDSDDAEEDPPLTPTQSPPSETTAYTTGLTETMSNLEPLSWRTLMATSATTSLTPTTVSAQRLAEPLSSGKQPTQPLDHDADDDTAGSTAESRNEDDHDNLIHVDETQLPQPGANSAHSMTQFVADTPSPDIQQGLDVVYTARDIEVVRMMCGNSGPTTTKEPGQLSPFEEAVWKRHDAVWNHFETWEGWRQKDKTVHQRSYIHTLYLAADNDWVKTGLSACRLKELLRYCVVALEGDTVPTWMALSDTTTTLLTNVGFQEGDWDSDSRFGYLPRAWLNLTLSSDTSGPIAKHLDDVTLRTLKATGLGHNLGYEYEEGRTLMKQYEEDVAKRGAEPDPSVPNQATQSPDIWSGGRLRSAGRLSGTSGKPNSRSMSERREAAVHQVLSFGSPDADAETRRSRHKKGPGQSPAAKVSPDIA